MEIWKKVKGFECTYEVSNFGNVKSLHNKNFGNLLNKINDNYLYVNLFYKNKRLKIGIHRLVAISFIPNPENKPQVNHKDGNKLNNNVSNLEWNTSKENIIHSYKNNLQTKGNHKLTKEQVIEIRKTKDSNYTNISKKYNVTRHTISNILKNKTWINL